MAARLVEGHRYVIVGKPTMRAGKMTFSHPDVVETAAPEEHDEKDEQGENDKSLSLSMATVTLSETKSLDPSILSG